MMESLDSERVLTICLSVWTQHRSVSSRQTDRPVLTISRSL